jgi:predicted DNA-binding transcriptional regulator AlpA
MPRRRLAIPVKPERIARMPDWPARMDEVMAADYLGIGVTTFRERVKEKRYPQPVHEGARKLWSRQQLDRFIAAQFGLTIDAPGDQGASDGSWDDL